MKRNFVLASLAAMVLLGGGCTSKATSSASATSSSSSARANDTNLLNGNWKLVTLNGKPVLGLDSARTPQLAFQVAEQRVTGHTGCNRLTGGATATVDSIRFGALATTRMACLGESLEQPFLAALSDATFQYRVTATELTLFKENQPVLVFAKTEQK